MVGSGEPAEPSVKDLGISAGEEKSPHGELIAQALKTGRSTILSTHSADPVGGGTGWGAVCEERDPRRSSRSIPYKSIVEIAFNAKGRRTQMEENLAREGVHEIVVIEPLTADVMETKIVRVPKKSLFGKKYDEVEQSFISGQRPRTLNEIFGDSQEVGAAIYYYAADTSYDGYFSAYNTALGKRSGNTFEIETIVPLELAKQISTAAQKDPNLIRKLTEAFVQNYYSQRFRNGWENFGRPPYQKWDSGAESKMYFVDLIAEPNARSVPFDEKAKGRILSFKPNT